MTIHRIEVARMAHNDDAARIVAANIDHAAISNRVDMCAGGIARYRIPVLACMPIAWIVPSILNDGPMPNKEPIT